MPRLSFLSLSFSPLLCLLVLLSLACVRSQDPSIPPVVLPPLRPIDMALLEVECSQLEKDQGLDLCYSCGDSTGNGLALDGRELCQDALLVCAPGKSCSLTCQERFSCERAQMDCDQGNPKCVLNCVAELSCIGLRTVSSTVSSPGAVFEANFEGRSSGGFYRDRPREPPAGYIPNSVNVYQSGDNAMLNVRDSDADAVFYLHRGTCNPARPLCVTPPTLTYQERGTQNGRRAIVQSINMFRADAVPVVSAFTFLNGDFQVLFSGTERNVTALHKASFQRWITDDYDPEIGISLDEIPDYEPQYLHNDDNFGILVSSLGQTYWSRYITALVNKGVDFQVVPPGISVVDGTLVSNMRLSDVFKEEVADIIALDDSILVPIFQAFMRNYFAVLFNEHIGCFGDITWSRDDSFFNVTMHVPRVEGCASPRPFSPCCCQMVNGNPTWVTNDASASIPVGEAFASVTPIVLETELTLLNSQLFLSEADVVVSADMTMDSTSTISMDVSSTLTAEGTHAPVLEGDIIITGSSEEILTSLQDGTVSIITSTAPLSLEDYEQLGIHVQSLTAEQEECLERRIETNLQGLSTLFVALKDDCGGSSSLGSSEGSTTAVIVVCVVIAVLLVAFVVVVFVNQNLREKIFPFTKREQFGLVDSSTLSQDGEVNSLGEPLL